MNMNDQKDIVAKSFGLRDLPIDDVGQEKLGLGEYADALTEFATKCDTPMTIALQGDWGSGKTSLMNLIKNELEANYKNVELVWFNTWQYSQFGQSGNLAVSMISSFIDAVCRDDEQIKKNLKKTLWQTAGKWGGRLAEAGAVVAGSLAGQGDTMKDGISVLKGDSGKSSEIDKDPATLIKELKCQLEKSVSDRLQKRTGNRIVVFIDDLDRLMPQIAVELLESLKMFLDLNGCVFMLACDYQVVEQGLKQKFGSAKEDLKGKSFFDKIIQVPFNMPLSQYNVNQYFMDLLDRIEIDYEEDDIKTYVSLVDYSVGFNPRSMKRLFNSLFLLKIVAEKKLKEVKIQSASNERMRTLFGLLCMQLSYEGFYKFLLRGEGIDDKMFKQLQDPNQITKNPIFKDFLSEMKVDQDAAAMKRFQNFMEHFYEAIQIKEDGREDILSKMEVENLKSIISFSAVVSTEVGVSRAKGSITPESFIDNIDDKLKNVYKEFIEKWDAAYTLYWGTGGFSVGVYIGDDKKSVFYGYSNKFSVIRKKDCEGWKVPVETYEEYVKHVGKNTEIQKAINDGRMYVKNDVAKDEREFRDIFQATTDFMESVRNKDIDSTKSLNP